MPILVRHLDRLPDQARVSWTPNPEQAAAVARAHWALGGAAILLVKPPVSEFDAEPLIEEALAVASAEGIRGAAVTPFVLARRGL